MCIKRSRNRHGVVRFPSLRSKRFRGVQEQRIINHVKKRGEGGGEGRKETLADKPLDFENHPLGLSCLSDLMLLSAVISQPILCFHVTSWYFPNMDVRHICAPLSMK